MPFQKGHKLGGRRREKYAHNSLVMALKEAGEDMPQLRLIWDKAIKDALNGDKDARREIFDRLDGKPPQALIGDMDEDPISVLQRIERVIVDPNPKEGSG